MHEGLKEKRRLLDFIMRVSSPRQKRTEAYQKRISQLRKEIEQLEKKAM